MQTCRTVQFFNMRKCNTGAGIQFGLKYIFYGFMVNISGRSTQGVKRSFKPSQIFKYKKVFEKIYYKCILLCSFVCFKFSFEASEILKNFPLTFFWSKFSQYWYNFTSKNLFVNSTRLVEKMMLRNCISHYQQKPGCSQWDIKQREKKQLKCNLAS